MLIGIDGGGTKTALCLAENDGHVLNYTVSNATNPADIGIDECKARLSSQLDALLEGSGGRNARLSSVYAGIAGSGAPELKKSLHEILIELLPNSEHTDNGSDGLNALYGELKNGEGIALISGTGSSAFAVSDGEIFQVGGWGYLIDDAGSGYRIGADALKAAYRSIDGRGRPTLLTQKCIDILGSELKPAIPNIYSGGKKYIASFAKAVLEAYLEGDIEAARIVKEAAEGLSEHLIACIKHISAFPVNTVVSGGLITHPVMLEQVKKALGDEAGKFEFIIPDTEPVFGALAKAAQNIGIETDADFKANYKGSLRK